MIVPKLKDFKIENDENITHDKGKNKVIGEYAEEAEGQVEQEEDKEKELVSEFENENSNEQEEVPSSPEDEEEEADYSQYVYDSFPESQSHVSTSELSISEDLADEIGDSTYSQSSDEEDSDEWEVAGPRSNKKPQVIITSSTNSNGVEDKNRDGGIPGSAFRRVSSSILQIIRTIN
jgi:hypothetical protein